MGDFPLKNVVHEFLVDILPKTKSQTFYGPFILFIALLLLVTGCGRTRRVNWVYFSETWLKILNNLTRLKVGYNEITGLHFMSGRTEMGYEVGSLN